MAAMAVALATQRQRLILQNRCRLAMLPQIAANVGRYAYLEITS